MIFKERFSGRWSSGVLEASERMDLKGRCTYSTGDRPNTYSASRENQILNFFLPTKANVRCMEPKIQQPRIQKQAEDTTNYLQGSDPDAVPPAVWHSLHSLHHFVDCRNGGLL